MKKKKKKRFICPACGAEHHYLPACCQYCGELRDTEAAIDLTGFTPDRDRPNRQNKLQEQRLWETRRKRKLQKSTIVAGEGRTEQERREKRLAKKKAKKLRLQQELERRQISQPKRKKKQADDFTLSDL